jgi:hypothetical protein
VSAEATAWVFQDAPAVKPHWVSTLMVLANDADSRGRGAHPYQADLARATRKDVRNVRETLKQLEAAGLIRKGDQRLVDHYDADERPVVWDLAMELVMEGPDASVRSPVDKSRTAGGDRMSASGPSAGKGPDADIRPDVSVRPKGPDVDIRPDADIRSKSRDETGHNGKGPDVGIRSPALVVGGEEGSSPPPTPSAPAAGELTSDEEALLRELAAARPDWSPGKTREVLLHPDIRQRPDRQVVRRAFLIAAMDRRTTTARRLLHEGCPAWRRAMDEVHPPAAAEPPGGGGVPVRGAVPWCRDPGCDPTTRDRVDPRTGNPVTPRRRCPSCHPKSPAVQP